MGIERQLAILKHRFYFSGMVRPTDQETIVIEKIVCHTHRS